MTPNNYDAIVVGSGISGGWASKELTEKGLKVLLLERGRNLEHIKDYVEQNKPVWEYPHRHYRPTKQMIEDHPILHFFNNMDISWALELHHGVAIGR